MMHRLSTQLFLPGPQFPHFAHGKSDGWTCCNLPNSEIVSCSFPPFKKAGRLFMNWPLKEPQCVDRPGCAAFRGHSLRGCDRVVLAALLPLPGITGIQRADTSSVCLGDFSHGECGHMGSRWDLVIPLHPRQCPIVLPMSETIPPAKSQLCPAVTADFTQFWLLPWRVTLMQQEGNQALASPQLTRTGLRLRKLDTRSL